MEAEVRKCPQCTVTKPITEFELDKRQKCNLCKQKQLEYDAANKEKNKERRKRYREKNAEKVKAKRRETYLKNKEKENEQSRQYHIRNKEAINKRSLEYAKKHKEELKEYRQLPETKEKNKAARLKRYSKVKDRINKRKQELRKHPKRRLDMAISTGVRLHLLQKDIIKEGRSWKDILGFTIEELIMHLESKFDSNMNWNNYGTYWHIDHIKPKSWFIYESVDDPAFKECWSLDNLQPLEAKQNMIKGNRYEG